MPNRDYLRTWRTINESMPDEVRTPFRSHVSAPPAKIGPNKGLSRIDTPIREAEPNTSNWADMIMNRTPIGKVAELVSDPGNLFGGPLDDVGKAVSWFGTKANRIKSGENLLRHMREQYPDVSSPMRQYVEEAAENYPRVFAHSGDFRTTDDKSVGAFAQGMSFPSSKLIDMPIPEGIGNRRNAHGDLLTVPKLESSKEKILTDPNSTLQDRKNIFDQHITVGPSIQEPNLKYDHVKEWWRRAKRHEFIHSAQQIGDPYNHARKVKEGRGQIKGLHDSATSLKDRDYMLEPVEVGAYVGENKGMVPEKVPFGDTGRMTTTRPRKHTDVINEQLDQIVKDFQAHIKEAGDKPIYSETYSATTGKLNRSKFKASKEEYTQAEPRVYAAALQKINDHVLPHFNKRRPDSDPLVFAIQNKRVPNIAAVFNNPSMLGDMIRQVKVQRLSQTK